MEENNIQQEMQEQNLVLNKQSLVYLTETRKWTMFFAILGFIAVGMFALAALVMLIIGAVGGTFGGFNEAWIIGILGVVYLGIGVLYLFPVLYLLKFSINSKKAIEQNDSNFLTTAFQYLKSHYRFIGIMTIVIFGLYLLVGVIAGIVAIASLL